MSTTPILHHLFDLGRLKVYYATPKDYFFREPGVQEFYWCDDIHTITGPFRSIHEAMQSYTAASKTRQIASIPNPDDAKNMIYVDFKKKSKIPQR